MQLTTATIVHDTRRIRYCFAGVAQYTAEAFKVHEVGFVSAPKLLRRPSRAIKPPQGTPRRHKSSEAPDHERTRITTSNP
jgi:hypothetical protein